jgi:hypothetical protein
MQANQGVERTGIRKQAGGQPQENAAEQRQTENRQIDPMVIERVRAHVMVLSLRGHRASPDAAKNMGVQEKLPNYHTKCQLK